MGVNKGDLHNLSAATVQISGLKLPSVFFFCIPPNKKQIPNKKPHIAQQILSKYREFHTQNSNIIHSISLTQVS